jgi:hypothetical protein
MLRPAPKNKATRRVAIPKELREALAEVREIIGEAQFDGTEQDFDDAIQTEVVCGGIVGPEDRPIALTYFLPSSSARWELELAPAELEDIADGAQADIFLHCCQSCKTKSSSPEFLCSNCDYEPDPDYAHLTPAKAKSRIQKLGFDRFSAKSTRDEIIANFGPPTEMGGGFKASFGYVKPWIKYHRKECQLRFEFAKGDRVSAVTFLPKNWKPGSNTAA